MLCYIIGRNSDIHWSVCQGKELARSERYPFPCLFLLRWKTSESRVRENRTYRMWAMVSNLELWITLFFIHYSRFDTNFSPVPAACVAKRLYADPALWSVCKPVQTWKCTKVPGTARSFTGVAGSCQPVSSGDDAKTHRQGHHALSLLRERNHASGLPDTGRVWSQWIWNSASIRVTVSILT